MWFDVWPTFWHVKELPEWRDAMWAVLSGMLEVPRRAVQIAGLHGIGHEGCYLGRLSVIDERISRFVRAIKNDEELRQYALAAKDDMVQ